MGKRYISEGGVMYEIGAGLCSTALESRERGVKWCEVRYIDGKLYYGMPISNTWPFADTVTWLPIDVEALRTKGAKT